MTQTVREQIEERERSWLSPYACLSQNSRGWERSETPCDYRTCFQRDRDRIIHSKAFRRLMHKTQVFLSPEEDHYRTRLTHTLEVMQIARTVSRALFLNEDLCEAIACGHDLGHTPFGHAGETVLQNCYAKDFSHAAQSLRVVEVLEKNGAGLNLTYEVRDGIRNHTGGDKAATLEGIIVKYADRIAYINHDIDDAIRAGVIVSEDIPKELRDILGESHKARINTMVSSLVRESARAMGADDPAIRMESEIGDATDALRRFMFKNVYLNPVAKRDENKAMQLLEDLYHYFTAHPEKLPPEFRRTDDPVDRRVCDYISGMTDRYAIRLYSEIHIPNKFRSLST